MHMRCWQNMNVAKNPSLMPWAPTTMPASVLLGIAPENTHEACLRLA